MNHHPTSEPVKLRGRVAEVIDESGQSFMTILVDSFYLTVDNELDLHLGDKVELDVRMNVKSMRQGLSEPYQQSGFEL